MSSCSLHWERAVELLVPLDSRSYCKACIFLLAQRRQAVQDAHCATVKDQLIWMESATVVTEKIPKTTRTKREGDGGWTFRLAGTTYIIIQLHLTRRRKQRESLLLSYSAVAWNPVISQMKQDSAIVLSTITCTSNTHIYHLIFFNKI